MGGRPRRLLGPTVGSAVVLAVSAFVLWGIALWVSWGGSCPNSIETGGGLDKGVSVWPPAAQCATTHGGTFWHEALPWATWVIGGLIVTAAGVLLIGLIVAIRDLRRPATATAVASMPRLGAGRHDAVEGDEPDRRAMAA
jgi:hypothetical protein